MIQRTCQQCEKPYETFPSIRLLYCGKACSDLAKKNGEWVPCSVCGAKFYRRPCRPNSAFCSKSCARTARNLTDENPAYHRDVAGEKNPMHGKGRFGEANPMYGKRKELSPRWKGGLKNRGDGYVLVAAPDDHPYPADVAVSGTKYMLLHRRLMEESIGRYLDPMEVVHHIDGDPSNNVIENLQLFACQADHMSIGHAARAMSPIAKELYEEVIRLRAEVERLREGRE